MTKKNTRYRYATNVHGQPNANASDAKYRVSWDNPTNATSKDGTTKPNGNTVSHYFKSNKKSKPWTFTAHDFKLNLPDCAYINNLKFTVRMRCSGKLDVKAPYARFNIYNGTKSVDTYTVDDTGWDSGYWYYNTGKKLKNTWDTYEYSISGAELRKRGYPISSLNDAIMGIDLIWYTSKNLIDSNIYIDYVMVTVDYELADPVLTFDTATSGDNPRIVNAGEPYDLTVNFENRSNASCCNSTNKPVQVTLPPNTSIVALNGSYNVNTNVWTVPCTPNAKSTLKLRVTDYSVGLDKITFANDDLGSWNYWLYNTPRNQDVGDIHVYPQIIQKGVKSCIEYHAIILSNDGNAVINVNVDTVNSSSPNLEWSIDYQKTKSDVTIDTANTNNAKITLNLPTNSAREVVFKSCFIPSFTGDSTVTATMGNATDTAPYTSLPAPTFHFRNTTENNNDDRTVSEILFNKEILTFKTHRVASSTELDAYVIDCGVAEYDNMTVNDCTLSAFIWEEIDYIGMIPLEYHHYDPKSSYENKAISESYKNKTYKGKEGTITEDITLNFKIRPWQSPTLQGLVKLDKPTPINANHRCFEGDPLNHRGWVVLSKAEIERTNPLWYDVKATVDYITHNINTKFQIFKEDKVNTVNMPDLQADVFELGSNLSTALDIFNIDTDGGFVYDEDSDVGNIFALDEGQHLLINTLNSLTDVSKIRFDWYSNRIDEIRENEMARVFRLRDKDGNSVFEYEYTDFVFVDDYVSCTVIIRYINDSGAWETIEKTDVDLRTEIELDPIVEDDTSSATVETSASEEETEESETISDETDDEEEPIAPDFDLSDYDVSLIYGTSLVLSLNHNKLLVSDEGYSGKEVYETLELTGSDYTFETYWRNNNQDGTTEDIISYVDMSLSQTMLNTQYSEQYSNLIVSPFPIPYKKVVFTRESEEGTIFYLTGDEPFKYRLEPFYQYYCGTDLVTREGTSIFDLNNSHDYFYIENGLVRLGFNRYNGGLYLAKWDIISKSWVTTHYFQMNENTIFSLASYSDDKITIKAGADTYFTIWRGHPYIMMKNPNDTIKILSKFNYCLSDKVEGEPYDYPVIHSFLNTDNLLPSCIGGRIIDYRCITVDDDEVTTGSDITLSIPTLTALADNTLGVTLSPSSTSGKVYYIVDGVEIGYATNPFTKTTTIFKEAREYTVQAVYVNGDNVAISDKVTVVVNAPEPATNSQADNGTPSAQTTTGKYKLEFESAPHRFTYRDGQKIRLKLTRGNKPMPGMVIEKQIPTGTTWSSETDGDGIVEIVNDSTSYVPGQYQWGGRFYDNWDEDADKKLLYKALRYITIDKATPTFTINSNIIQKGGYLHVKLNGVDSIKDTSKSGLGNQKITYTFNGGTKKTKTTKDSGKIYIPCVAVGTHKVKVMYAGSARYKAISKTFTIVVIP